MADYNEFIRQITPGWLKALWGDRWFQAVGTALETTAQSFRNAVTARLPGTVGGQPYAPSDGLPLMGRERQLDQAPGETNATFADRLRSAWDAWGGDNTPVTGGGGGGGSFKGLLLQLQAWGYPVGTTGATIIQHNGWSGQLVSGSLVLTDGPVQTHRQDLKLNTPGTLVGFTLDARDQFWSKFAIIFPTDVSGLRAGTAAAANLNKLVRKWKPAKAIYVGAHVIAVPGAVWEWPITRTWEDGSTVWEGATVYEIPPG